MVHCKPSFGSPEFVIEYLGRYTNKIAISNYKIIKLQDHKVTFRYKDYADDSKVKFMTVDVFEFIRRFLLHILPYKFVRIRYYGIFSNRYRKTNLNLCCLLLKINSNKSEISYSNETWQEIYFRLM